MSSTTANTSSSKTVLVTGANKGLGYHTVRLLAEQYPLWKIILASRDRNKGEQAVNTLKSVTSSDNISLVLLDITSSTSIKSAMNEIKDRYHQIDYLIQNAGIGGIGSQPGFTIANNILQTNVFGVIELQEAIKPLLNPQGLTIIVSSDVGARVMNEMTSTLQSLLNDISSLSKDQLQLLTNDYMKTWITKNEKTQHEWPDPSKTYAAYGISKALLNAYIRVWLRDAPKDRIVLVTPGHCATDLNNNTGTRSPEQGARSIIWPILHEHEITIGEFYHDGQTRPFIQQTAHHHTPK